MMLKNTLNIIMKGRGLLSKEKVFLQAFNSNLRLNLNFSSKIIRDYESMSEEMKAQKAVTVPEFFLETVKKFADRPALMHKNINCDKWSTITYKEYHEKVEKIAKAFIKLGLEQYGSVSVLAFNCPEWFISQLASNHAGGQIVGIYATNSPEACHFILESSRSNIVVVDDSEQLEKILKVKDRLPHLKSVVKIFPSSDEGLSKIDGFYSWDDLEAMDTKDVEVEYKRRLNNVKPDDCSSLCYTSGTTGTPKGAILTHDNFVWETNSIKAALQCFDEGNEVVVSYLPMAHMSAQLNEMFMAVKTGATVYFADKNAFRGSLINTLKDAHPTYFGSVPRLYEKFYERLLQVTSEATGIKKSLLDWARKVALQYHLDRINGNNPGKLQYVVAKKLVLNKVKLGLGFDRTKAFFVGASPISLDVTHFFMSLDIILQDCYGLTENTGIAFARASWHNQLQSVGKCLPGLEAKILNPDKNGVGEICTRGRSTFKGYIHEIEKTNEAFDEDGWLRTGDLGRIDTEGYLYITGRIKELVITAGGENIPFLHIENLVKKECAAISNAFLIGDKRKFISMLITLKTEPDANNVPTDILAPESLKLMRDLNLNFTKMSEVQNHPKVIEAIQAAIDRANKNAISNAQKVQKFALLSKDFSIQSGEFAPSMKLKRSFVLDKFKDVIEKFYN